MCAKFKPKFPMARIKRIMQADEEIGKVAQQTPVVISSALELFLEGIVEEALKSLQNRPGRVTKGIIKKVIMNKAEYDFLQSLVEEIPDEEAGDTKADQAASSRSNKSTPGKRTRSGSASSVSTASSVPSTPDRRCDDASGEMNDSVEGRTPSSLASTAKRTSLSKSSIAIAALVSDDN